jgi:membrane fusion protein, multidrug efflux system
LRAAISKRFKAVKKGKVKTMQTRLLLLAVLVFAGCKKPSEEAQKKEQPVAVAPVSVQTASVEMRAMPKYLTLTGSISADRQSEIAANVSGRVTATYVERGMPVKQGQVLAVVDSRAAGLQAAAATAQSQAAQTQVSLARQECERADTLFNQGAIPKSEYDRLKTQCTAQLYQANAAQANADLAGKLAGDTVIRSPMDGFIGERYVNVGEYVQPPTRVASVFSVNPVRVSVAVPEQAVSLVQLGQSLDVTVSSWPNRTFPATVRFVSPNLRANTRDLMVEATSTNADQALRPGMFAVVKLVVGESEQPTVPESALRKEGSVKRLFMVRDKLAYELVVRTGESKDGRVAILDGLKSGERVVLSPPSNVFDGSAVKEGAENAVAR